MSNVTAWHAWCATPGDLTQTCVLYTTFFPAFFAAILAYGTAVIIARRKLHGIRKSIRKNSARPFDDPVFASCGMLETQCSTVIEASTERSTVEARPSESMAARPSESLSGAPPPARRPFRRRHPRATPPPHLITARALHIRLRLTLTAARRTVRAPQYGRDPHDGRATAELLRMRECTQYSIGVGTWRLKLT